MRFFHKMRMMMPKFLFWGLISITINGVVWIWILASRIDKLEIQNENQKKAIQALTELDHSTYTTFSKFHKEELGMQHFD